jgi:hypothetical protein
VAHPKASIPGLSSDIADGGPGSGDLTLSARSLRDPDHEPAVHHSATRPNPTTDVDAHLDFDTDDRHDSASVALADVLV